MKEKVIYIANDGTEFEKKADCILYDSEQYAEESVFKYVSFYNVHKEKIQSDLFIKSYFNPCQINDNEDAIDLIDDFLQDVYFIHISKEIPDQRDELLIQEFMENLCDEYLPEITRFDFKKGITYYYDEDIECFTNTEYEKKHIKNQTKFLTELENFE